MGEHKYDDEDTLWRLIAYILTILIYATWAFVWSVPLMFAWNYVMPYLFNLPEAGYWHIWCLYVILTSLWQVKIATK